MEAAFSSCGCRRTAPLRLCEILAAVTRLARCFLTRDSDTFPGVSREPGLQSIVRALLDCRDEEIAIFGTRGETLHMNLAAQATLPPTPLPQAARLRADLLARGGRAVLLQADGRLVREMIIVPQPPGRTLAEQERQPSAASIWNLSAFDSSFITSLFLVAVALSELQPAVEPIRILPLVHNIPFVHDPNCPRASPAAT